MHAAVQKPLTSFFIINTVGVGVLMMHRWACGWPNLSNSILKSYSNVPPCCFLWSLIFWKKVLRNPAIATSSVCWSSVSFRVQKKCGGRSTNDRWRMMLSFSAPLRRHTSHGHRADLQGRGRPFG